jgi:hypothetical protein
VARNASIESGITGFFARPLVRGPFLVRRLSAFARNLALLGPIH